MKITKLIAKLQEYSDQYNWNVNVVIQYRRGKENKIKEICHVDTKCLYYKQPKPIKSMVAQQRLQKEFGIVWTVMEAWKINVIIK